ncbi:radical SAM protein, partial [Pseudomonas aeruginosa]|uniref:radical SAM protein n=1 Tax=Pseudomonas aeruginosa TaxID=287 RepID=UPI00374A446C
CKHDGINTAIETCGFTPSKTLMKLAEFCDLFLYDLKHMDSKRHNELTGVGNERILSNLKTLLETGYNIKVRMPMLKEINDSVSQKFIRL